MIKIEKRIGSDNTEKAVYLKDVEEAEKGIELLEDYVHNQLRTPVFKEVTEAWL